MVLGWETIEKRRRPLCFVALVKMVACDSGDSLADNPIIEIPDSDLDLKYVKGHILTNTDLFLENHLSGDLRTWHIIFMVAGAIMVAVISLCCIFKCRIPRTKSEIEANAKRRALLKNFRLKLKSLKAADLDDMDYRAALEKLREEFKADSVSLVHSEAISILSLCDE